MLRPLLLLCLLLAATGAAVADWEKPDFCRDSDCPRYEMVNDGDGFETRKYEEAMWVHTRVKDLPGEEAVMRGYALLFNYFHGGNKDGKQIQMGVPVAHNISVHTHHRRHHRLLPRWLGRWLHMEEHSLHRRKEKCVDMTIKAYLPYTYQDGSEQAPEPSSDHVHIDKFPEWTAHVHSFDGFPTKRRFAKHFDRLVHALEKAGEDFEEGWAVFSVYDPPHELEDRHNEVLVPAGGGKKRASKGIRAGNLA